MGCSIYGRETVRYSWLVVDEENAVQADTLDWTISDILLDGSDNTTTIVDAVNTATQDKIYESAGTKQVETVVDFDDGWGNVYQHKTELEVEALVYEEPILGLSWTPEEPTILDEVVFTQEHDDTRDGTIDKQYGRIDAVDVDYYQDGADETGLVGDAEFTRTFTPKQDGIPIQLTAEYWDGWETQTVQLVKYMDQSNIPPVSDHTREDAGQCIPAYVWTATSHDEDDALDELTYSWSLYKKNNADTEEDEADDYWEVIDSGIGVEYTYPFQFEGDYKIVLRTTDSEGDWHEKIEEFPILFDTCTMGDDGKGGCEGTIILQPNRFQMVAIPVKGQKVKEYFLDKIAETVGADASTVIELVKSYPSNDVSDNKFQVFVPDLTNPASSTNFELIQIDGSVEEITAFAVITREFPAGLDTIEFAWTTEDEVILE